MTNYRRVFVDNSYIFITVAINNRKRLLLIDYSDEFKQALKTAKKIFQFEIHAISIMPDHFHVILRPKSIVEYPKIVSLIKKEFTKSLPNELRLELLQEISESKVKKRESGVWQRRYYEHTIRNEDDLNHLTDYIHYNPVKHGLVKRAYDWEFSSFKKFVLNGFYDLDWCDFTQLRNYH
jgi:putative transposase